jgi:hypothetical protein
MQPVNIMTQIQSTDIAQLRRDIKKLLVDLDMDHHGYPLRIRPLLEAKMGRKLNINTIRHAMTGEREGPTYINVLQELYGILKVIQVYNMAQKDVSSNGLISGGDTPCQP